ncbi:MAG: porin [Pseudomonadota bacterium]|nr:porin [Pseudomonadota bacterium]
MKKQLLITLCAGVSINALTSSACAEAKPPSLKMSGFTSMIGLSASQKQKQNGKGGADPSFAIAASDLRLTVDGKSVNDFGYKYILNFKTRPGQNPLVDRNYVEFDDSRMGAIQIGVVKGVDDSMPVNAYTLIGGTGGVYGSAPDIYNFSEGVIMGTGPIGGPDIATKINWFSPIVHGFQFAVSYTPNTSHVGKGARDNSKFGAGRFGNEEGGMYPDDANPVAFGLKNVVYGLSYIKKIEEYTLTLNGILINEHSRLVLANSKKTYALNRTKSYQLSAMLGIANWDFAAGWIDNKKSRLPTQELLNQSPDTLYIASSGLNSYLGNSGTSWNAATRYSFGAYQAALGYFRTDRKTDAVQIAHMDAITATLDFKALEGLKFFGEVNYLSTKTNKTQMDAAQGYYNAQGASQMAVGNNTGAVLILGTKVSF